MPLPPHAKLCSRLLILSARAGKRLADTIRLCELSRDAIHFASERALAALRRYPPAPIWAALA